MFHSNTILHLDFCNAYYMYDYKVIMNHTTWLYLFIWSTSSGANVGNPTGSPEPSSPPGHVIHHRGCVLKGRNPAWRNILLHCSTIAAKFKTKIRFQSLLIMMHSWPKMRHTEGISTIMHYVQSMYSKVAKHGGGSAAFCLSCQPVGSEHPIQSNPSKMHIFPFWGPNIWMDPILNRDFQRY